MSNNIYDILSRYKHSSDTEQDFIKQINAVRSQINMVDLEYGTPIMHYCTVHLQSGISYFVLHTLIVKFHANVNYAVHNNLPLRILLEDPNIQSNSHIIELLLQYTTVKALITIGKPRLLVQIFLKLTPQTSQQIDTLVNGIKLQRKHSTISAIQLEYHLAQIRQEFFQNIINLDSPERIKSCLHFLDYISYSLNLDTLLSYAIHNTNRVLIQVLFESYKINLTHQFNSNQINLGILFFEDHSYMPFHPGIEKVEDMIAKYMLMPDNMYYLQYIIVICNKILYIPTLTHDDTKIKELPLFEEVVKRANSIIKQYVSDTNVDINTVTRLFGFNNNIFHFIALNPVFKHAFFIKIFGDHPHLLAELNQFGQSPLKIALLCNNHNAISLFASLIPKVAHDALYKLDNAGSTIGHIIASTSRSMEHLEWILSRLSSLQNTNFILSSMNARNQSPIHIAVLMNNNHFIDWWKKSGGKFDLRDGQGRTLWYYFIQRHITFRHNTVRLSITQRGIYNKLKVEISEMLFQPDNDGNTAIHYAVSSPAVLELLLKEYNHAIDYGQQNALGDTISHIMSHNFVEHYNKYDGYIDDIHQKTVALLMPYHNQIKSNYQISNKAGHRPIDIIQSILDLPLALWIHHKISHDILKGVSELLDVHASKTVSTVGTGASSDIPIKAIKLENQPVLYDNRIIFFSPHVVQQMYEVQVLQQSTHNIIHALSFEIAYSVLNDWDDTVSHLLTSLEILEVDNELTVLHLFKILDKGLIKSICNIPNKLGQFVSHMVVQYDCPILLKYILSINPEITVQGTQAPQDIEKASLSIEEYPELYPYDYAIILQSKQVLKVFQEFKTENPTYIIKSNIKHLIPGISETSINDYILGTITPQNTMIHYWLRTNNKSIKALLERTKNLNEGHNFFPTFPSHLDYLQRAHNLLIYEQGFYLITNIKMLPQYLNSYRNFLAHDTSDGAQRTRSFALLYEGHASSLVVFKDRANQFHALIHDSMYTTSCPITTPYAVRLDTIKKVLYEVLQIDQSHIYELKVAQQSINQNNCGLWTVANIKFMQFYLLEDDPRCFLCIKVGSRLSLTEHDSNHILYNIENALKEKSPLLVHHLEQALTQCHHQSCNLEDSFIRFSKLFDLLVSDNQDLLEDHDDEQVKEEVTLQNDHYLVTPLSDQNIREIMNVLHESQFSIHGIDTNYDTSHNGLVIISEPEVRDELSNQISDFVDLRPHEGDPQERQGPLRYLTRTFIINKDQSHWVTLVIQLNPSNAIVYFADSFATVMPQNIKNIVELNLSQHYTDIIINAQVVKIRQQNDHYNCGLWAIKNAVYIDNTIKENRDIPYLESMLEKNVINDRENIIEIRKILPFISPTDIIPVSEVSQRLQKAGEEIGITPYISSCPSASSSLMELERRKRAICQEVQSTRPVEDSITVLIPEDDRIKMQLYFDIASLAAFQDLINHQRSKIDNTLKYIGNIYEMLSEPSEDRTTREEIIIQEHYTHVNKLTSSEIINQLLLEVQDTQNLDSPMILRSGYCSLVVYHYGAHYLLYSQNYNHNTVYKTKTGVTFYDIKKFASLIFSIYSYHNPVYHIFILEDNEYRKSAFKILENADIWKDKIRSDLSLLESSNRNIKNIPLNIIRTIFLIDDKVPDIKILNDDFFDTHMDVMSLRINKLHKALLHLTPEQVTSLKAIIKKYKFKIDNTYIEKVSLELTDTKSIVNFYHNALIQKIDHIDSLTVEDMSELSWKSLEDVMLAKNDITDEMRTSSLQRLRTIYTWLKEHGQNIGVPTQALFLAPDLIKAVNYNEYLPFIKSVGLNAGDITLNALYHNLITKLEEHVPSNKISLLKKFPFSSPIFKILTIDTVCQLVTEWMATPDTSEHAIKLKKQDIAHKLGEQIVTIGLMIAEISSINITPLWLILFAEQLIYNANYQINSLSQLHVSRLEAMFMSLGFEQDKLHILQEEADLVEDNLRMYDKNNAGLVIVKIPHVPNMQEQYENINKDQIPADIVDALHEKAEQEKYFGLQRITKFQGYALVQKYRPTPDDNRGLVFNGSTYQKLYYQAYPSDTHIHFGSRAQNEGLLDSVFTDEKQYGNHTWVRIPMKKQCTAHRLLVQCNKVWDLIDRDTGTTAMYYELGAIEETLSHKYISSIFDPREGNFNIQLSNMGVNDLDKFFAYEFNLSYSKDYTVIMRVQHKPNQHLKLNDISSNFSLSDGSGRVTTCYIITDTTHGDLRLKDNAKETQIIFQSTTDINDQNYLTVYGPPGYITYCTMFNGNLSYNAIQHLHKIKLSISFSHNYVIGTLLQLSDERIFIEGVRGQSKDSTIELLAPASHAQPYFNISMIGDIKIVDNGTVLSVLGQNNLSNSSIYHKTFNQHNYAIRVAHLAPVLTTIKRLNNYDINSQHISFQDGKVQYFWSTTSQNKILYISTCNNSDNLMMSAHVDIIHYASNEHIKTTEYIHYNSEMIPNNAMHCKKIFINSTIDHSTHQSLDNIDKVPLLKFRFMQNNTNSVVLLFEDNEQNQYYHIFVSNSPQITINHIDYHITSHGICTVYTPRLFWTKGPFLDLETLSFIPKVNLCPDSKISATDNILYDILAIVINSNLRDVGRIAGLKDAVQCNNNVDRIWLSRQGLTVDAINTLVKVLRNKQCNGISSIDLSHNELGLIDTGFDHLIMALMAMEKLEIINLAYNGMTDSHASTIFNALRFMKSSNLTILLNNNYISLQGLIPLLNIPCDRGTIQIDIASNQWHAKEEAVEAFIQQEDCTNVTIYSSTADSDDFMLSFNQNAPNDTLPMSDEIALHIFNIMMDSNLRDAMIIKRLHDMSNCRNNSVHDIILAGQGLKYQAMSNLSKLLEKYASCNIHTIDLSNNNIGNNIDLLLPVLPNIHGLKVLNMTSTNMNDISAINLFNITSNMNMKLNLAYNFISSKAILKFLIDICNIDTNVHMNIVGNPVTLDMKSIISLHIINKHHPCGNINIQYIPSKNDGVHKNSKRDASKFSSSIDDLSTSSLEDDIMTPQEMNENMVSNSASTHQPIGHNIIRKLCVVVQYLKNYLFTERAKDMVLDTDNYTATQIISDTADTSCEHVNNFERLWYESSDRPSSPVCSSIGVENMYIDSDQYKHSPSYHTTFNCHSFLTMANFIAHKANGTKYGNLSVNNDMNIDAHPQLLAYSWYVTDAIMD